MCTRTEGARVDGDGERGSRMPRLRLDRLLDELQSRIDDARGARDRLHSLLEAVLSVGRELDVTHVLQRIVEAAATLVDARYAALGVIGPDGRTLDQMLTVGLTPEEIEAIGPYPRGEGILGELIRHPEPLRLSDLAQHPASSGFPPNHPPMRTFVGVPLRVRDEVFGNLYLTDKRGGEDFDDEDEAVLQTLAVAAGVAIDNARLYEEARQQQSWLRASAEITRGLLSGSPRAEVLELVAQRAREITGAELADVSVPLEGADQLRVELALGARAQARLGLTVPAAGTLSGAAVAAGSPVTSEDIDGDPRLTAGPRRFQDLGPAVAVPLAAATGEVQGVLLLARRAGERHFSADEIGPLLGFADQAALALQLADHRRDAEQLALLEDRDRIARDLHDLAIQRLFAAGMTLRSTTRLPEVEGTGAGERVGQVMGDLDETIKIIRSAIFGLRSREEEAGGGLRARAARAVEDARRPLGFPAQLSLEGLLDTDVPPHVADHVVAVLSEALSNVARHAGASTVRVALRAASGQVELTVTDDGVGLPDGGRRSGLRNAADRAEDVGGTLRLTAPPSGGTCLTWTAPLR
ncbi:GAF domain-containing protein [Streptomyces sp. NPDC048172]|uniref:GAF domain-containing sensor histidine kinase n=1 Tax=Streptomyces sp. NPDC048172 TaxID=3365505 RepID=UPI00371E4C6D